MCIGGMRAWVLQNIGVGYCIVDCSASGACGMHIGNKLEG